MLLLIGQDETRHAKNLCGAPEKLEARHRTTRFDPIDRCSGLAAAQGEFFQHQSAFKTPPADIRADAALEFKRVIVFLFLRQARCRGLFLIGHESALPSRGPAARFTDKPINQAGCGDELTNFQLVDIELTVGPAACSTNI